MSGQCPECGKQMMSKSTCFLYASNDAVIQCPDCHRASHVGYWMPPEWVKEWEEIHERAIGCPMIVCGVRL